MPPCLTAVSLELGVPCIKWADHITYFLGLCVCMEWGAKLEKAKGRLGSGEAGITGLWVGLAVQRSRRSGSQGFSLKKRD